VSETLWHRYESPTGNGGRSHHISKPNKQQSYQSGFL